MPHYLTLRFDITGLSSMQIERLKQDAMAQAKSNRKQCKEAAAIHPNVAVDEVCHFCGQVLENDECGGEGEGGCSESLCAALYKPVNKQALDVYVREFCDLHGIENTLVPYRNDGLTYYQQLAYFVTDYHDLPEETYNEAKKLLGLDA